MVASLWSPELAQRIGDWAAHMASRLAKLVHRPPVVWSGADLVRFRAEAIGLLRNRWQALTITTLANQLAVFLVLIVALRALGVTRSQVDVVEAFAAWSLIRALGLIPVTPGGLGVEEVALSGALVGFGSQNAEAVAATLVYRFMTVVPSVLLGLASVATYNLDRPKAEHSSTQTRSGGSGTGAQGSRMAATGQRVRPMRIRDWFQKLRKRDEANALDHAQHLAIESPAEREISKGDIGGMKADMLAGEAMLEVGLGEAERLGE
jgi:Lysylphosphatidylglycerol synthase TM region